MNVLRFFITLPLLSALKLAYRDLTRPLIFRLSAQDAHERMLELLRFADQPLPSALLHSLHALTFEPVPTTVGGVTLVSPLILAAGLVKGDGFANEAEALAEVETGRHMMPGYRSMPALVGAVEFGSFTRWPRLGNPGVVMWRDAATRSTQNRVGLKNPGAAAAAAFLHRHIDELPRIFGINIAVSPGIEDTVQEQQEVSEAVAQFQHCGIRPTWVTLNISCPNTEDDPGDHQTETRTRALFNRLVAQLDSIPLWVKISPTLADSQYRTLLRVFEEEGVRAVIATNTDPQPTPDDGTLNAGVAGGRLHDRAVEVVKLLSDERKVQGYHIDIIGCGGVQNAPTYFAMKQAGAQAVQYWSALIYQGPLAAAFIQQEIHRRQQEQFS